MILGIQHLQLKYIGTIQHWNKVFDLKESDFGEEKKKYQNCYIIPDLWENMSLVLHFTQLPTKEDTTK